MERISAHTRAFTRIGSWMIPILLIGAQAVLGMTAWDTAAVGYRDNLLLNPGFENWENPGPSGPPDSWVNATLGLTSTQESVRVFEGAYSANLTWTSTDTQRFSQDVLVLPEGVYTIRIQCYDNDPAGRARFYCYWRAADGTPIGVALETAYTVDSTEWQVLELVDVAAPAEAHHLEFAVRLYDVSPFPGTATVYVDAAEVTGPPPIPTTPTITPTPTSTLPPTLTPTIDPFETPSAVPTSGPSPTVTPTPMPGDNLVLNPGFEYWEVNGPSGPPDSWVNATLGFTATQESLIVFEGTYAVNLTWTSTDTQTFSQDVVVLPGDVYTIRFQCYDNDPAGRVRFYGYWRTADGTPIGTALSTDYTVDAAEWQVLELVGAVAPTEAHHLEFGVRMYDVAPYPGTATVYLDAAELSAPLPTLTPTPGPSLPPTFTPIPSTPSVTPTPPYATETPTPVPGDNQLLNPGFESWEEYGPAGPPDSWVNATFDFTAAQETVRIFEGNYSVNLTWTSTDTQRFSQDLLVTAGSIYTLRIHCYDNDPAGRIRMYCYWRTADGTPIGSPLETGYTSDSEEWQVLALINQVAPGEAHHLEFAVRMYDVSPFPGTATVYVDAAELIGPPPPTPTPIPSPTDTPFGPSVTPITPTETPTPPTVTETPTTIPSITDTPTTPPTVTETPTRIPSITATPSDPTATPTTPPTSTPTLTPSVTATPPDPTATPVGSTRVELLMPADYFRPGDECWLHAVLYSTEATALNNVPFAVVLDINIGVYYFYDGWTTDFDYESITLNPGITDKDILPSFLWPEGAGSWPAAYFYSAFLTQDLTALFGDMSIWQFGWGE